MIVRDPTGKRKDEAFFCTDVGVDASFILETYARRWTLEVTFHDAKQYLGFEDPQSQTVQAVRRTAPLAGIVYDLTLLWAARRTQTGQPVAAVTRPWYRTKAFPSFLDLLTALRLDASWRDLSDPPVPLRRMQKLCPHCPGTLPASA